MAENEITEDIVLELKTNFESELRATAAHYAAFQKRAGNVSRSVEQNINVMYKRVSSNLSSMMQGVQKTIASSINLTRGAMRSTQNESIALSKSYENYVKKVLSSKKKIMELAESGMSPEAKKTAIEGVFENAKIESIKHANDMYAQLGSISRNASQTILMSTENSLNSVKELARGVKETLVKLEVDVNNKKTMESVSGAEQGLSKAQQEIEKTKNILKEQAKQVIAAEKEMQNARIAVLNQTDEKLLAEQEDYYRQTVQNVTKTQKAYKDTEKEFAKLTKTFEEGKQKVQKEIKDTKDTIQLQAGKTAKNASADILNTTKTTLNAIKNLSDETKSSLVKLEVVLSNSKNVPNALDASRKTSIVENKIKESKKLLKDQARQVIEAEKKVEEARIALSKQTNDTLRKEQEKYFAETQKNARQVQKAYRDTEKEIQKMTQSLENSRTRLSSINEEISSGLNTRMVASSVKAKLNLRKIKEGYNAIEKEAIKLSKVRFIKKENVDFFRLQVDKMKDRIEKYNLSISELQDNLRKLEMLHKKGLSPNAGPLIEKRRQELNELKANVKEITALSNRATSKAEQMAKKTSKGMFNNGLEMIRNFRWQVAGFIYLISKAVHGIKRVFFDVLSDVQKFRIDAMSIAGSIVYGMMGNTQESFKIAYEYSKDLLRKLEMEAARTVLTLEDMTQMTKTFSQAGMIPKTDQDVRNIATIGTAIKTLTEGMANAGVQMRQELYAVILGRQRATDQLAMMFKFVGINIQKVIDEAKKEGKSVIEAMAEALQPFEEVNKKLGEEYQTQINKLNIIWDRIKRIGAESTLDSFAESIKKINKALFDVDGNLTSMGLGLARALQLVMETINGIIYYIGSALSSLVDLNSESSAWQTTLNAINGVLFVISSLVDVVISESIALFKILKGIVQLLSFDFKEAIETFKSAFEETVDLANRAKERLNYAVDANDRMAEGLKNANNEALALNATLLSLPFSDFEAIDKMQKKINEAQKDALSGPNKIEFEYQSSIKGMQEIKKGLNDNYNIILKKYNEYIASGKKLNKEEEESIKNRLQAQIDGLNLIKKYEDALYAERLKKLSEWEEKQKDHFASLKYNIDSMMESFEVGSSSKMESVLKKYRKEEDKVEKLIKQSENEFDELIKRYKDEFYEMGIKTKEGLVKAIRDSFAEGKEKAIKDVLEETKKDFESFMESLKSHDVMDPLEQITNEFEKQRNIIKKKVDWTFWEKAQAYSLLDIYKKQRIELAKTALQKEAAEIKAERDTALANLLSNSYKPRDIQKAELIRLEAQYENSKEKINAKIEEINQKWKENGEWVANTPENVKQMIPDLMKQLDYLGEEMEYHKKQIQEPFWNDLREMSKGWFDEFADVLNEAAFDLDSFSDNFKKFMTDIARQASRAWIKNNITDNLMNMFSFGTPKIDKEEAEKKSKKNIFSVMATGWEKVSALFKTGFDKFVEISKSGFDLLKNGLNSIFNVVMSVIKGIGSGINSGISAIGSLFSGGSTIAMASGGVIKEPVIGRGLQSGKSYSFGEGGKPELVTPMNKVSSGNSISISIPISIGDDNYSNAKISKLRSEMERTARETTMRVLRESI